MAGKRAAGVPARVNMCSSPVVRPNAAAVADASSRAAKRNIRPTPSVALARVATLALTRCPPGFTWFVETRGSNPVGTFRPRRAVLALSIPRERSRRFAPRRFPRTPARAGGTAPTPHHRLAQSALAQLANERLQPNRCLHLHLHYLLHNYHAFEVISDHRESEKTPHHPPLRRSSPPK